MTQENKELLLKDLCARLPYNLVINCTEEDDEKTNFDCFLAPDMIKDIKSETAYWTIKPYLRPMSSMTIDELNDCVINSGLREIPCPNYEGSKDEIEKQRLEHSIKVLKTDAYCIDWLNRHHFDYRGLIKKGLALKAPEDMYKS